jgi:hypothetical protein
VDNLIEALKDPATGYWIGWWSTVGCFMISFYAATYIADQPRLTTVLALFAGSWVLSAAAIAARIQAMGKGTLATSTDVALGDRAFDMAAFLFVFAGAALAREAPAGRWANKAQRWVQVAGLWLMFFLVLPDRIPKPPQLSLPQADLIVSEVLGVVGFISLALGISAIGSRRALVAFVALLVAYEALSLLRTLDLFHDLADNERSLMRAGLLYPLVGARLVLTGLVCYVVLAYGRTLRRNALLQEASKLAADTR